MKEIEVVEDGMYFDEIVGHYNVLKEGQEDIVVVRNSPSREIAKKDVNIMETGEEYYIKTVTTAKQHIVKPLETLEVIAKNNNTSKEILIKKNNLKTEKLFVGQCIKI